MRAALFALSLCSVSVPAFAQTPSLIRCGNQAGQGTRFLMHTPTMRGMLRLDNRVVAMTCQKAEPLDVVGADIPIPMYDCRENRGGDGLLLVRVRSGGFTGWTVADVLQQQIFPLEPHFIESLRCR